LRWCTDQLGLEAWFFKFWFQDNIPRDFSDMPTDAMGACIPIVRERYAQIWVSPSRCGTKKEAVSSICHEMVHVFGHDNRFWDTNRYDDFEHVAYKLENILAKAYIAGVR